MLPDCRLVRCQRQFFVSLSLRLLRCRTFVHCTTFSTAALNQNLKHLSAAGCCCQFGVGHRPETLLRSSTHQVSLETPCWLCRWGRFCFLFGSFDVVFAWNNTASTESIHTQHRITTKFRKSHTSWQLPETPFSRFPQRDFQLPTSSFLGFSEM